MKKIAFALLALLLISAFISCGKNDNLIDKKFSALSENGQMVYKLSKDLTTGKYRRVLKNYPFTDAAEIAVSTSSLYSLMFSLTAEHGKFKEIEAVLFEDSAPYEIYYVNLIFAKGKSTIAFYVNSEGQIESFISVPYKAEFTLQSPIIKELPIGVREENVIIGSEFKLSGKLTLPEAVTSSVVIFVHDSNLSDMDGTLSQNKPYRDIAYDLASKGVASLRYDKKRFMYGEVVATDKALTPYEETIEDILYAIDYLKVHNVALEDIYIAGHGMGGFLIPEIAAYTDDISGYIFLCANSSGPLDLAEAQAKYIASHYDKSQKAELAQMQKLLAQIQKAKEINDQTENDLVILDAYPNYWRWFLEYFPLKAVKAIDVPMLFLQCERDYEVPLSELSPWLEALKTRTDVKSEVLSDLNHLLMEGGENPLPTEYQKPSLASPYVAEVIANFVESSKMHPAIQQN